MKIAVIGGGIGGLSAALHLLQGRPRRPCLRAVAAHHRDRRRHPDQPQRLAPADPARPEAGAGCGGRAAARRAPAALGRRPHPAARAARPGGRGDLRRALLSLPSRRPCQAAGRRAAGRAPACRPQAGRPGAEGRAGDRALRERRVGRDRTCWSAPTASIAACATRVRAGEAALHRLRRLARAGAGRAHRASRHRGRLAQLDGAGRARRSLLGRRPGGS